jgi:hypothetical protein
MAWLLSSWSSAVGKKAVMAVSGIALFGFVLVHMLGNLKVYQGPHSHPGSAGSAALRPGGACEGGPVPVWRP